MINQCLMTITVVLLTILNVHAADGWKEQKSRHFIIYYKNAPKEFVNTVEENAEEYYEKIAQDMGFVRYKSWSYDDRAKVYIFDNQDHYINVGRQIGWSSGTASIHTKTIRTFPAAHGFFDTTLPHELAHIILREFSGEHAKMPQWFEEGVAMYQEKAKRWGANDTVRKAIEEGTFIPLNELTYLDLYFNSKDNRELVDLFYAESASVVNYLITEHGEHRFKRFIRELSSPGTNFEWALAKVYVRFKSVEDLNEAWVNFLK